MGTDETNGYEDESGAEEESGAEGEFTDSTELPPFPPEGADAPQDATIGPSGEVTLATSEPILGPFNFCFYVNGRYWGTQPFYAPDPDTAALLAQQRAAVYQAFLQMLYPRATLRVTVSPC
jgi:hypothetical protein